MQALGGAVAVVMGTFMSNSNGPIKSGQKKVTFGKISVQDSVVEFNRNRVENCSAVSLTDISLGSSSAFGGALAIVHSAQVFNLVLGVLLPSIKEPDVAGFNLSVLILNCSFLQCSVFSNASSVQPGEANGEGGAVYAKSAALINFSITNSSFNDSLVSVASGSTGLPSFSRGGALSVEAGNSNSSFFAIASCSFFNCTARGASISNMGVLGAAVCVRRVAHITVAQADFNICSIFDAVSGKVVSGGSAISASVTGSMSIYGCVFDASGGEDTSQTSTGLLILARNSSHAHVNVSSCFFLSSKVVISVQCVGDDDARRVAGLCVGPDIALVQSRINLLASQTSSEFSAVGNDLMTLQQHDSVSFTGSRMHCGLPQFAAFKTQPNKFSFSSVVYFCRPCPSFHISLTATSVSLEDLEDLSNARNVDRCYPVSSDSPSVSACPFAVTDCTTFAFVTIGFWTNVSEAGQLEKARRCPRGYCGCTNSVKGTCLLPPLISLDRNRDPLCNGNRIGKLCGGCPPDFTQSMDDMTCISDEACSRNLWWVWTLSTLGFLAYSLFIVVSCRKRADGAFSCLLFYFQISSFAADYDESSAVSAILEYAQVRSIVAMYKGACYAPGMSAYNATAFKLIGPLLVFGFAVVWTWILQKLQPRLQQRNVDLSVSYSGTLSVTILFVFSSVTNVVFTLVECASYSGSDAVLFVDGTVPCMDAKWSVLVFVAAILLFFPAAFAATLRLKQFPPSARDTVCGKFTAPMFYWGAVTLSFRLLISVTQFMRVDVPNLMAFVRSSLSTGVFALLLYTRPYAHVHTFWVDVACYVCLIAQFGLQGFAANRDFLGVAQSSIAANFYNQVLIWSTSIRCMLRPKVRCG